MAASCSRRELDEPGKRLLASFAYQASVALQKARLYWKQLEAAEIANALLDASRELATAESPEDVLGRVEVTCRVLGTERAALWIQEEPGDLVARRAARLPAPSTTPRPAGASRARSRTSGSSARSRSCSSRPDPDMPGVPDDTRSPLRGCSAEAGEQPRRRTDRDDR